MKRPYLVLPLLVLLLGLAVFMLRKPAPHLEPGPAHDHASQGGTEQPPASAPAPNPVAPAAAPSSEASTGALRFLVTLRGKVCPDALITVGKTGTPESMKFKTEPDGTQFLHGLTAGPYVIAIDQEEAVTYGGSVLVESGKTAEVTVDLKSGGRVTGTVTDRMGRPVPGTRVFLLNEATNAPANSLFCLSDAKGTYSLSRIPPGSFGVRYRHMEYKPLDRLGLVFRGGAEDYRIDVILDVGARFSGRVVDEADSPIAGAQVLAGNGDSADVTKSAEDGTFTLTGFTDTPANVSASKAGYGKVVLRNLPGSSTNVVIRLPKAGTILGRLLIDYVPRQTQINLSKYDEELKQIIPMESRFFALPTTATFSFSDVSPGTYWIDVIASGYEAVDRPQVVVASGQVTNEVRIAMRKKN